VAQTEVATRIVMRWGRPEHQSIFGLRASVNSTSEVLRNFQNVSGSAPSQEVKLNELSITAAPSENSKLHKVMYPDANLEEFSEQSACHSDAA
jgi:hypothetical protein